MRFVAELEGETAIVEVTGGEGRYTVTIGGETWEVDARQPARGTCSLLIQGASYAAGISGTGGAFLVEVGGEMYRIRVEEETRHLLRTRVAGPHRAGGQVLAAPMPGKVVQVAVREGQAVNAGDGLVVVEAMKMENEFKATVTGTVKEVRVQAGQSVNAGDVLIVIE